MMYALGRGSFKCVSNEDNSYCTRSTKIFEEYFANTLIAPNLLLRNYKVVDLEYELQIQFCRDVLKVLIKPVKLEL